MSGLKNTAKRLFNLSIARGYKTDREIRQEREAKRQASLDKVYADAQMPDKEYISRNERRKASARRGSRQRNILTDNESLG